MSSALDDLRDLVQAKRELPAPHARRALREAAGLSLSRIARTVGVSRQTVFAWETGLFDPCGENLARYMAVLRLLKESS